MLYRLSQCRIPALIALLAILMLFIAPEVSRALEHRHAQSAAGHVSDVAEMSMPGMEMGMSHAHHDGAQNSGEQAASSKSTALPGVFGSQSMMDDFACGYCQLLAHFPVLMWIVLAVILLLFITSRLLAVRYIPAAPVRLFPGVSQPRAPPVCF